jgi:ATP-dependent protease HslVU (ClpYQ) peptidase subunit
VTVIVGIQTNEGAYIAGDSACVSDYDLFLRAEPKIFRHGDFIMGTAGGGRLLDVAKYDLRLPVPEEDTDNFMRTVFIDTLRDAIHKSGSIRSEEGAERFDGNYLVAFGSKLYIVLSDFSIHTPLQDYAAIGAGAPVALGTMYATEGLISDPVERLQVAVHAAEVFNASVRGPFHYLSTTDCGGCL